MQYRSIDTFPIDEIKDEQLPPEIPSLESQIGPLREFMSHCLVVTVDPSNDPVLPFDGQSTDVDGSLASFELAQLGPIHQRSFELVPNTPLQPWSDEFGNKYGGINLKGNNFSHPDIIPSSNDNDLAVAYGLQQSDVIRRLLRASRLMRSRGIGTEFIMGLAEPKTFPWPRVDEQPNADKHVSVDFHEQVNLAEYKRRLTERHWLSLAPEVRTPEAYVDIASKFDHVTFYILLRGMDTSFRLSELNRNEAARANAYDYVNQHLLKDGDIPFSVCRSEDIYRFGLDYVGPRLADNLARLHDGMAHGFLTNGNITALGSIVDLDSVHGSPLNLGDEPVTLNDKAFDVDKAMHSLAEFVLSSDNSDFAQRNLFQEFGSNYMRTAKRHTDLRTLAGRVYVTPDDDCCNSPSLFAFNQLRRESFVRAYAALYPKDVEGKLPAFDDWIVNRLSDYEENYSTHIQNNLPELARLAFIHYIEQINQSHDFDFLSPILNDSDHKVRQDFAHNILFLKEFEKWLLYHLELPENAVDSTEIVYAEDVIDPSLVAAIEAVRVWYNNEGRAWSANKLEESLPQFKCELETLSKTFDKQPLFKGDKVKCLAFADGNQLLIETSGVTFSSLMIQLAPFAESLTIEYFESVEDEEWHAEMNNGEFVLREIVVDKSNSGVKLIEEDYLLRKQLQFKSGLKDYLLYVTKNTEDRLRLHLLLTDKKLVEHLEKLKLEQLANELLRLGSIQPTLF